MEWREDIFERKYCYSLFCKVDIFLALIAITFALGMVLIKGV